MRGIQINIVDALKEIEGIKNQLIEKYRPERIILFGSAAWVEGEIKGYTYVKI